MVRIEFADGPSVPWEVVVRREGVAIKPHGARGVLIFTAICCIIPFALMCWKAPTQHLPFVIPMGIVASVAVCGILHTAYAKNERKGNYFVYDNRDRLIQLPRHGIKDIPLRMVTEFRIEMKHDEKVEGGKLYSLMLCLRNDEGAPSRSFELARCSIRQPLDRAVKILCHELELMPASGE